MAIEGDDLVTSRRSQRFVAAGLIVFMLIGCSKAVVVPASEVGASEYREPGSYRIRLKGWDEYYARRFSVTDSTVVIHELLKSDDRYKLMKHDMPIVVPMRDVEYIGVMKTNRLMTGIALGAFAAFVGFLVWAFVSLGIDTS